MPLVTIYYFLTYVISSMHPEYSGTSSDNDTPSIERKK